MWVRDSVKVREKSMNRVTHQVEDGMKSVYERVAKHSRKVVACGVCKA